MNKGFEKLLIQKVVSSQFERMNSQISQPRSTSGVGSWRGLSRQARDMSPGCNPADPCPFSLVYPISLIICQPTSYEKLSPLHFNHDVKCILDIGDILYRSILYFEFQTSSTIILRTWSSKILDLHTCIYYHWGAVRW